MSRRQIPAKVQGFCETTLNVYEGELELDKPAMATLMGGSGYYTWGCFLLSTNPRCIPDQVAIQRAMEPGAIPPP